MTSIRLIQDGEWKIVKTSEYFPRYPDEIYFEGKIYKVINTVFDFSNNILNVQVEPHVVQYDPISLKVLK